MQFFLDGFHTGDPAISPTDADPRRPPLEDAGIVDVLIVGSGPAGLVLGAQLSQFPTITTRIIERRDGPLALGQADGVACRTVEMFQAFGLSDQLLKEAYWVNETAFWQPDPDDPARIVRSGRVQDVEDDLSEFPHVICNQARVHDHLLGAMERSPQRLEPDYGLTCESLEFDPDGTSPAAVTMRRGDRPPFTVRARYVVGCDGARSVVRESIGQELRGDRANHAWGVMDVLAVTDFPDYRLKCAIQSATEGSILLIPREGGYLARLYVDLGEVTPENRDRIRGMTVTQVVEVANRVWAPHSLDVREVAWFSVYEVAQRVADRFDDGADADQGRVPQVFIAGDACHTHSAKAGQGMNVSMQDAFNLGWKLGAVLEHRSPPELLRTYSQERQPIARELIDFDREWSAMLAGRPTGGHGEAPEPAEVQDYFVRQGRFTAGVSTRYRPSMLTGADARQALAGGFEVGTRLHSAPVIRVADARRMQLGHAARADGRWRLYAFADSTQARLDALIEWLAEDPASPVVRFTPKAADVDSVLDLRAILQRPHREIAFERLPRLLRPHKGRHGLTDYEKVFTAPLGDAPDIFERRGVDRERGCVVIVRPDQYISDVLGLDARQDLTRFFNGLLDCPPPTLETPDA